MAKRHVVLREEYMDGIEQVDVHAPTEHDEFVQVVEVGLLEEYYRAADAYAAAQERLRQAMAHSPRRRNPKYVPEDRDDG